MKVGRQFGWQTTLGTAVLGALAVGIYVPNVLRAAPPVITEEVTYAKDIAPILQRSCENCHRPNGAGPMPLTTYEEVRPWARSIKARTGMARCPTVDNRSITRVLGVGCTTLYYAYGRVTSMSVISSPA